LEGKWLIGETEIPAWLMTEKYDTREDAIAAGLERFKGDEFDIGQVMTLPIRAVADVEAVLDHIHENHVDEHELYAEEDDIFKQVTPEQYKDLDTKLRAAISAWITENNIKSPAFQINGETVETIHPDSTRCVLCNENEIDKTLSTPWCTPCSDDINKPSFGRHKT
jgi:hypothetical protein